MTTLATTCPACGTCFRVVQDQLKVSEGWVRCGHCQEVFNALEGLFELDAPPPQPPIPAPPAHMPEPGGASPLHDPFPGWLSPPTDEQPPQPFEAQPPAPAPEPPASPAFWPSQLDGGSAEPPIDWQTSPAAPLPTPPAPAAPSDHGVIGVVFTGPSADSAPEDPAPLGFGPSDRASDTRHSLDEPDLFNVPPQFDRAAPAEATGPGPAAAGTAAGTDVDSPTASLGTSPEALQEAWQAASHEHVDLLIDPPANVAPSFPCDDAALAEPAPPAMEAVAGAVASQDGPAPPVADAAAMAPPPAAPVGETLPNFVRMAEQRARWERPGRRAVLSSLSLLLGLGIVAQVAWHGRDRLAYAWPALRPVLSLVCRGLGCTLQPPQVIDALVVDNTTMVHPPGVEGYRLSVILHNRADHPVAVPHLELALSDAQGGVVVRRVLRPDDFRVASDAAIPPQSDVNWTLEFTARDPGQIAGYTVAAFYP